MQDTVAAAFAEHFGSEPTVVTRAPGRLEILGNHTDYNEGLVISCAPDRATWVAAGPAAGAQACVMTACDDARKCFDPRDPGPGSRDDWSSYIRGIVVAMQRRGVDVPPFNAYVGSTIPLAAGMSSSAALEIATAYALGHLAGASFDPAEWARIGQDCENNYVGANTGLLDQFTSVCARENHLVHIDFRTMGVEPVHCPEAATFVVADTGVKHDLTTEYNERRRRCEAAAAFFAARDPHVKTLRDVSLDRLEAARTEMDVMDWRRARHIVGENDRVHRGVAALRANDLDALGALLFESHDSSREYFENSCPELDILVELAASLPGCLGARLSGGGFGGISIHLVRRADADTYCERLANAYRTRTDKHLETRICAIAQGAEIICSKA